MHAKYGPDPLSRLRRPPIEWLQRLSGAQPASSDAIVILDDEEAAELEAWLCKNKGSTTRRHLLDKFTGLETLIREFHHLHEFVRGQDEPCSFDHLEASFNLMLKERREKHLLGKIEPDVPESVSRGWFSDMKVGIGILKSATASNEIRRLTVEDSRGFWAEYADKAKKFGIKITNVISYDEYNDFLQRSPKYVQSSAKERRKTIGRRSKRTGNARVTLTGGLVFTPLRKGKMILFMDGCPKAAKERIERDFGDTLIVITNQGSKFIHCNNMLRVSKRGARLSFYAREVCQREYALAVRIGEVVGRFLGG